MTLNKPIINTLICLIIALSSLTTHTASAQDSTPNATIDIFASQDAVNPGDELQIGIRQTIRENWHTYWKNAGDSGEPISIEWDLPNGIKASDLTFPTPKEIRYDPLVNYGYEGAPIYLQTITIDEDFNQDNLILEGTAYWLVCEEICIPEQQEVSLNLPVIKDEPSQINNEIFRSAQNALPEKVDWPATLSRDGKVSYLTVTVPEDLENQFTDITLFPYEWGVMKTADPAIADIRGDGEIIFSKASDTRDYSELIKPKFVIKTANAAYEVTANVGGTADLVAKSPTPFLLIILFAFLGGLILNLMPCVFPVLSMKALSLVKLSMKERLHAQQSGLAYTAGIIISFLAIAIILIVLKEAGASIGWGFQLQNPYVVTILSSLLFLIGLNLFGLIEISSKWSGIGQRFAKGNDVRSSFMTGVLACVVATPCTAPFMASALGYAMTQSALVALIVFAMLGFGLAFPYLLLCYVPKFQKILPKPGPWMETFRQFLAFPMFASSIWLLWVLSQQSSDLGILYVLGLFLSIIFIIWLLKKTCPKL